MKTELGHHNVHLVWTDRDKGKGARGCIIIVQCCIVVLWCIVVCQFALCHVVLPCSHLTCYVSIPVSQWWV